MSWHLSHDCGRRFGCYLRFDDCEVARLPEEEFRDRQGRALGGFQLLHLELEVHCLWENRSRICPSWLFVFSCK